MVTAKRDGFGEKTISEWMLVIRSYLVFTKDSFPELRNVFTQPLEDAPVLSLANDLSNFDDVMYEYLRLANRKTFREFNQTFSASAIPKVYGGVGLMNLEKTTASPDAIWVNYWEAGAQPIFDTVFSVNMFPKEGTKYCKQKNFHDYIKRLIRNLEPWELTISTPYSEIQYSAYADDDNPSLLIDWVNWYPEKLAAELLKNEPGAIPFEGGTLLTLDEDISCMDDLTFLDEISRLQNLLQPVYAKRKQKGRVV